MKKLFKWTLAVLLVFTMVCGLTGCVLDRITQSIIGGADGPTEIIVGEVNSDSSDTQSAVPSPFADAKTPQELVKRWENYYNFGVCCDFKSLTWGDDGFDEVYADLTDNQLASFGALFEITCCDTAEEAEEHLRHYIDDGVLSTFDYYSTDCFAEHGGKLYYVMGAMGTVAYDEGTISSTVDGDELIITADLLNSGGGYDSTHTLTAVENGSTYKITDFDDGY